MKLSLQNISGPKKIIALDLGDKNTGFSISDPNLKISYVLQILFIAINLCENEHLIKRVYLKNLIYFT